MRLIHKYKNAIILLVMLCVSVRGLAQYTLQAVYPVKGPGCNGGFDFKTGGSTFPLDIYIIQSLRDLLQNSFEDESELAKLPFSGKLFQDLKRASDDFIQYVLSHTGQFHSYDLLKAFPNLRTDIKLLEALDAAVVGKSPAEIEKLRSIINSEFSSDTRKIRSIIEDTRKIGRVMDEKFYTQNYEVKSWIGKITGGNNQAKGAFGEIVSDAFLTELGFTPLHTRKLSVLDGWGETGIDAIFKRGDEYFIVEAKYGTAKLNPANPSTNLFKQMTDDWIVGNNRIRDAVGGDQALADEISKKYRRLVAHISPDGTVVYDEIDGATKIIGSFP